MGILDSSGAGIPTSSFVHSTPEAFLEIVAPHRDDLVVAAGGMFTWYWLADLCAAEGRRFRFLNRRWSLWRQL